MNLNIISLRSYCRNFLPYSFLRNVPVEKKALLWVSENRYFANKNEFFGVESEKGAILCRRLNWDSDFFGKNIFRMDLIAGDPSYLAQYLPKLEEYLSANKAHYCFAILPVEETNALHSLGKIGWSVIEPRTTYFMDRVQDYQFSERYPVRLAEKTDLQMLMETSRTAVNAYDRFHSDPFFSPADSDRFMEKFVQASLEEGFADFVLIPQQAPKAFMTGKILADQHDLLDVKISQLVLSAVHPDLKGWYKKLVSEGIAYLQAQGTEVIFLTTQLTNKAVIKVWERAGFSFGAASLVLSKIFGR